MQRVCATNGISVTGGERSAEGIIRLRILWKSYFEQTLDTRIYSLIIWKHWNVYVEMI